MTNKPINDSPHSQQLYTDRYFEKGHWWCKIRQTLVAIVGWFCVILPIVVTIVSYFGVQCGHVTPIWRYHEGIFEIQFIGVVLLFLAAVALIFTVTMTIIQVRKRDRLVEQWPTFNPIDQKARETELEKFMDRRFGPAEFRQNTRNYRVESDQNLDTDEFHRLFDQQHLDQL